MWSLRWVRKDRQPSVLPDGEGLFATAESLFTVFWHLRQTEKFMFDVHLVRGGISRVEPGDGMLPWWKGPPITWEPRTG